MCIVGICLWYPFLFIWLQKWFLCNTCNFCSSLLFLWNFITMILGTISLTENLFTTFLILNIQQQVSACVWIELFWSLKCAYKHSIIMMGLFFLTDIEVLLDHQVKQGQRLREQEPSKTSYSFVWNMLWSFFVRD